MTEAIADVDHVTQAGQIAIGLRGPEGRQLGRRDERGDDARAAQHVRQRARVPHSVARHAEVAKLAEREVCHHPLESVGEAQRDGLT